MKNLRIITLLAVLMTSLLLPAAAQAQPLNLIPDKDDKVVFGGEFTLSTGETLDGDLISFGGFLTLEEGSVINGDLVSMGGFVDANGTINGDLVAMGSNVELGAMASIQGSLALLGSSLERASGAQVVGDVVTNNDTLNLDIPDFRFGPDGLDFNGDFIRSERFFNRTSFTNDIGNRVIGNLFIAFAMATIALLTMLFLPKQTRRIADAALAEPVAAGGLSLITFIALPILMVLLSITIILIPVVILLAFLCALALVFGWVAIGLEVGERLTTSLKQDWSLPVQAGVGTFALSFVVGLVGMIPCLGWLASFTMLLLSFGGVILTRFGTQSYPQLEVVPAPEPKSPAKPKKAATKKKTK